MTFTQVHEIWKRFQLEIALFLVGVAMVGGGIVWWRTLENESVKVEIIKAESGEDKEGINSKTTQLVVDISGEVKNPGVYNMVDGARVDDVIQKAGGFTDKVNKEWVEKYLNRSAKITDGQKIYIPNSESGQKQVKGESVEMININTASKNELESLPGIGPTIAEKIIGARPYNKIEELVEKKLVGNKVFEQIKASISVW